MSYKNNHVCYTPSKLTKSEEAEWKTEKLQMAVRHFEGVLENIPAGNTDLKREIKFDLAKALFNLKQYDEAVKIYEDGFSVSKFRLRNMKYCINYMSLNYFIVTRMMVNLNGFIKLLNVYGNRIRRN